MRSPEAEYEICTCLSIPDFGEFFPRVPDLGRWLRVALPCIGVNACGYALDAMQAPHDAVNVYDLETNYSETLNLQLQTAGQEVIRLNLGKHVGDLLKKGLLELDMPVDFLVAGPPCPPWAGQGCKKGRGNNRIASRLGDGLPPAAFTPTPSPSHPPASSLSSSLDPPLSLPASRCKWPAAKQKANTLFEQPNPPPKHKQKRCKAH